MEVILIEDVPKLGDIGDQVTVKAGFARNYLIPQNMAIVASTKNKARLEHDKRIAAHRLVKARANDEQLLESLEGVAVSIGRKVGEQDKLYGSVTTHDIEQALAEGGVQVDRRKLVLGEPIKALGVYKVPVRLRKDLTAEIEVQVVAEEEG